MRKLTTLFITVLILFNINIAQSSYSALDLTSPGSGVVIPGDTLTSLESGSWGGWVKFDTIQPPYQRLIYKEGTVELFYASRFEAEIVVNGSRYEVYTNSSFAAQPDQWYHVMATYDTTRLMLYVDGHLMDSKSAPQGKIDPQYDEWGIGRSTTSSNWSIKGLVDDIALFDKALDSTEIQSLMCEQLDTTDLLFNNLLAYYKMDEGTGQTIIDDVNLIEGSLTSNAGWTVDSLENFMGQGKPASQPNIYVFGDTLVAGYENSTYQWFFDGSPIASATNQTYITSSVGDYTVESINTCGTATSEAYNNDFSSLDEMNSKLEQVVIYPNPASEYITLNLSEEFNYEIISIDGRKMDCKTGLFGSNIINTSSLANGKYIVRISTKDKVINRKIIIE